MPEYSPITAARKNVMNLAGLIASPAPCGHIPKPYVIAEAGVNHEGSMDTARRLIDEAAEAGAQAVKFQTYKAATLASRDSPAYWDIGKEPTQSQYELFCRHDTFWKNEFELLKRHCDSAGIAFLSTPFDVESAVFLNELMDVYKISSSDITNKPFIEFMCDFGKPVILSTGAAHLHEIAEAAAWIEAKGNPLALLHCVINYPTEDRNAGLGMIVALQRHFPQHCIGYSDHTLPRDMKVLEIAGLLGARILEKHFTHDKSLPGNDHYHAMDKEDLKRFWSNMERALTMVGPLKISAFASEDPARRNARRSLVAARPVRAGARISREDLTWKRPAHGISPRDMDAVLGMAARVALEEDTVLQWKYLE
jgi:N-acetylneuraminate synthase